MYNMKIDYITSFVNGDDKEWGLNYLKYFNGRVSWANSATRFRDWDTLRFSLRGVCKHMPWVNSVFLSSQTAKDRFPSGFAPTTHD